MDLITYQSVLSLDISCYVLLLQVSVLSILIPRNLVGKTLGINLSQPVFILMVGLFLVVK